VLSSDGAGILFVLPPYSVLFPLGRFYVASLGTYVAGLGTVVARLGTVVAGLAT
jgi:hypothetical protein